MTLERTGDAAMISCGIEIPIAPNEQIYAFDEQRGQIGLCDFAVNSAARRSFVGDAFGAQGDSELREMLVRALASANRPARWVIAWHLSGQHRSEAQLRHFERKLQRAGYSIARTGGLGIGELTFEGLPLPVLPPGVAWGECGWFIRLGPFQGQIAEWPALLPTFRMLATTGRLQPSLQFIAAFTSAGNGFLYSAFDQRDATAWILVEPVDKILTIDEGAFGRTFFGQEAANAW